MACLVQNHNDDYIMISGTNGARGKWDNGGGCCIKKSKMLIAFNILSCTSKQTSY
jgi:hypothetical protein